MYCSDRDRGRDCDKCVLVIETEEEIKRNVLRDRARERDYEKCVVEIETEEEIAIKVF